MQIYDTNGSRTKKYRILNKLPSFLEKLTSVSYKRSLPFSESCIGPCGNYFSMAASQYSDLCGIQQDA